MDGNRRYEMVTSCDHLHGSHASYSDRTQMLGYNMSLYADIWMRDKMFNATVHGMSSGFKLASVLYRFICVIHQHAAFFIIVKSQCFCFCEINLRANFNVCETFTSFFLFVRLNQGVKETLEAFADTQITLFITHCFKMLKVGIKCHTTLNS